MEAKTIYGVVEFTLNPETGLPVLPDFHVWRVTEPNSIGNHEVRVIQQQPWTETTFKRTWFGLGRGRAESRTVTEENDYADCYTQINPWELTDAEILKSALIVLAKLQSKFGPNWHDPSAQVGRESLIGDYPPKHLGSGA